MIQKYHKIRYETMLAIAPHSTLGACLEWINGYGEQGWCIVATAIGNARLEVLFQRLKQLEVSVTEKS